MRGANKTFSSVSSEEREIEIQIRVWEIWGFLRDERRTKPILGVVERKQKEKGQFGNFLVS